MTFAEPRPAKLRLRLYPQSPLGGGRARLETVALSVRCGLVGPGPTDDRIYTIGAPGKQPYGRDPRQRGGFELPPWRGSVLPAAMPSADGHFDRVAPTDPGFRQVHLYGCVRFALDVWEYYLGRPIPWHFAEHFDRLELIALRDWGNAHMGYGYLEAGERRGRDGQVADLALDFDVIGHEVGHALMMSFGGPFPPEAVAPDYEAFHEASADWAAMIAALHFEALIEELMQTTNGDLDSFNRLNRFAEFSSSRQIRQANNPATMWDFAAGWRSEHDLALPVLAALWDGFVEVYNELLVRRGAISRALEDLAERAEHEHGLRRLVQRQFARAFARRPEPFYDTLYEARDIAATFLVGLWRQIDPTSFRFDDIAPLLAEIDRREFSGELRPLVQGRLSERGVGIISPGPRLKEPGRASHMHSSRTAMPI